MAKIALAAALVVAMAFLYSHRHWQRFRALQRHGVAADGWVTGKSAGADRVVQYAFRTPRQVHTGHDSTGQGTPEFASLEPGDEIVVFYHPANPDLSCLGDPEERLQDQNNALVYLLLITVPVFAWALKRELAKVSA